MATTSPRPKEAIPPPLIGKAGSYTVFITPPRTPKQAECPRAQADSPESNVSMSPGKMAPLQVKTRPPPSPVAAPPPVQVPPQQFEKPSAKSSGSVFGFFWDAVARVQDAHSSLDEYLANWFGLNQSKYQWALNDYYENSGKIHSVLSRKFEISDYTFAVKANVPSSIITPSILKIAEMVTGGSARMTQIPGRWKVIKMEKAKGLLAKGSKVKKLVLF